MQSVFSYRLFPDVTLMVDQVLKINYLCVFIICLSVCCVYLSVCLSVQICICLSGCIIIDLSVVEQCSLQGINIDIETKTFNDVEPAKVI